MVEVRGKDGRESKCLVHTLFPFQTTIHTPLVFEYGCSHVSLPGSLSSQKKNHSLLLRPSCSSLPTAQSKLEPAHAWIYAYDQVLPAAGVSSSASLVHRRPPAIHRSDRSVRRTQLQDTATAGNRRIILASTAPCLFSNRRRTAPMQSSPCSHVLELVTG